MLRPVLRLLAVVFPVALGTWPATSSAQSDPFVGTWQLSHAKSTFSPGPPPRSQSLIVQGQGQNRKATSAGVDAAGNPFTQVYMFIHDSRPHPIVGNRLGNQATYTPVDGNTVNWTITNGEQVVQTGTDVISADGRTFTISSRRVDATGEIINHVAVFDKQ